MIRLGIFAKTFARPDLESALDAVAASGLRSVQFNMALAGGPSLPASISDRQAARIRRCFAERGLEMSAVSGTYNMAHPDPRARARGASALRALVRAAPALGTQVVTLCTGSRDPEDMWRPHRDNSTAAAWADMHDSIAAVLDLAEATGVILAIEPEPANVVSSSALARRALDELASPHLGIVFDAANLLGPARLDDQEAALREDLELLAERVVVAHAKDVRRDGTAVAAGRGEIDYPTYLALLEAFGFDGPVVLHGLEEAEVPASIACLESALAR